MLAKTIEKLGGKPVAAKGNYNFPADQLKTLWSWPVYRGSGKNLGCRRPGDETLLLPVGN